MRLTGNSYAVMSLLERLGEASPYDLKRALDAIDGFWPVSHTTFYTEPARLARGGLLVERQESVGRRRKSYVLAESGRQALREWVADPETAPPQLHDEALLKIFAGGDPTAILTRRNRRQPDTRPARDSPTTPMRESPELRRIVAATFSARAAYTRELLQKVPRDPPSQRDPGGLVVTSHAPEQSPLSLRPVR